MPTSGRGWLRAGLFALVLVAASLVGLGGRQAQASPVGSQAAPSWGLDDAESAVVPQGSLASVDCRTATDCVAVGAYYPLPTTTQAFAEVWNGSSWRLSTTPPVSMSELSGVSCPAVERCLAVGSAGARQLSELWNGSTWRVLPTPTVARARDVDWNAVSCSASVCMAVGDAQISETTTVALSASFGGTAWKLLPTPDPTGSRSLPTASLGGVDCVSAASCTAVGSYANADNDTVALAESWNGSRWQIQATPDPSAGDGLLDAVVCSSGSCTAVGYSVTEGGATVPLTEQRETTAWKLLEAPIPSGAVNSTLNGLACTSARSCTAVGSLTNASNESTTVIEQMAGSIWTVRTSANPRGASFASLAAVSCLSAVACTAVGSDVVGSTGDPGGGGSSESLAESSSSSGWSLVSTPDPFGTAQQTILDGVACTSATSCVAVGDYVNASGVVRTLAETYDGSAWRESNPLSRSGASVNALSAVSCASPDSCVAVGSYETPKATAALGEAWDGKAWRLLAVPEPSGATGSSLAGVSCKASSCIAVGTYTTSAHASAPLAERWNGSSWSLLSPLSPSGSTGDALAAVSCMSASDCTAVGQDDDAAGVAVTLAEVWNGSAWQLEKTPNPSGATGSGLAGVSCASAKACVAVGSTTNAGDIEMALAESWNGTSWSTRPTVSPGGEIGTDLTSVSCTAASACTAAGQAGDVSNDGSLTLAEVWSGSSFTLQATRTPPSGYYDGLDGVSCTAASLCTAVGSYATSTNGESFALAETEK